MTRQDLIRICFAVLIILWLAGGSLPQKLAILEEEPRVSYDNFITSQEYKIRNQQERLNKLKSVSQNYKLALIEQLAHVLWSCRRFDEALALYQQAERERKKLGNGYDEELVNTLISLAGLYRDINRLDDSIDYYERIWQIDKANLPANDLRLARDQTSMAVIAYVIGETQQDDKQHETFLNNCITHINLAQKILQKQKKPYTARLANLLYLKYLAFRELGNNAASKQSRQAADQLTKQLKRPYVVHWS